MENVRQTLLKLSAHNNAEHCQVPLLYHICWLVTRPCQVEHRNTGILLAQYWAISLKAALIVWTMSGAHALCLAECLTFRRGAFPTES